MYVCTCECAIALTCSYFCTCLCASVFTFPGRHPAGKCLGHCRHMRLALENQYPHCFPEHLGTPSPPSHDSASLSESPVGPTFQTKHQAAKPLGSRGRRMLCASQAGPTLWCSGATPGSVQESLPGCSGNSMGCREWNLCRPCARPEPYPLFCLPTPTVHV